VAWIGRKFLSKAGQTVKVKAQLVPLSSLIDEGACPARPPARRLLAQGLVSAWPPCQP